MKLGVYAILLGAAILPTATAAEWNGQWISVNSNDAPMITGSGRIVSQPRSVPDFRAVETNGAEDIHVRFGLRPSLLVTADDNLLPYLTTEVSDGVLHDGSVGSYRTRTTPQVYVTVPDLMSAITRGSGDVTVSGVNNRELELITKGSGSIRADGRTGMLVAKVQGSGDAELRMIQAANADVGVYGSGDAWVGTNGALIARSYGSGDVHVVGNPASADVGVYGSGNAWVGTNGNLIARTYGSGDVFVSGHPASLSVGESGSGHVIFPRG
jgi:hypothetical protein